MLKEYSQYIGNSLETFDVIAEYPIKAMSAVLDYSYVSEKGI